MGEKTSSRTSECKSCSLQPPPLILFFFSPSDYVLGMPLYYFPGTFWQETCQQLGNFNSVSVPPPSHSSPQGVHLLALLAERFSSGFALLKLPARLELLTNSGVCPGSASSMAQLSAHLAALHQSVQWRGAQVLPPALFFPSHLGMDALNRPLTCCDLLALSLFSLLLDPLWE